MMVVGLLIFLLNLFDGVATFFILAAGDSIETNPLMSFLIYKMGGWFLVPKILIGFIAGSLVAIGWKKYRIAKIGGTIVMIIYGLIAAYHVVIICLFY